MKKLILIFILTIISYSAALADTYVNGYYRKNGTYVKPHYRSSPNSTTSDNWSTKGNVNPYTGKVGTKSPSYNNNNQYNYYNSNKKSY